MSAAPRDPLANPPAARRHAVRLLVQIVGLLAGAASLAWCISMALREKNRQQLDHLLHAPARLILAILALSLATLAINGLLFWIMLAPVRRLRIRDLLATNALCTMIAYLPLKLGAVMRVIIHNRRDHIPLATIGAWFTAMLGAMAVAYAPPLLATLWLGQIGPRWLFAVAAGALIGITVLFLSARAFRGRRGLDRLVSWAGAIPLVPLGRLLRTKLWGNLHAGFDMLASPGAVTGSVVLRLSDIAVTTARFAVAAAILGVNLPLSQALPISITYFLIGIISPAGLAGLREGAATGLAGLLLSKTGATHDTIHAFAGVALLVTATEAVVNLTCGSIAIAWVRPDRLLRGRTSEISNPTSPTPPASAPRGS